jgi:hypothetical protein
MNKLSAILVATTVAIGMSLAAGSAFAESGAPSSDAQDTAVVTVDDAVGQTGGEVADAEDGAEAADAEGADAADVEDGADVADVEDGEDGADVADVADTPDSADDTASPRSQEVASVPRAAAKQASTVKGSETGKLVSEWAKTHANKKVKPANVHVKAHSAHVKTQLTPKSHSAGHGQAHAIGHGKNG